MSKEIRNEFNFQNDSLIAEKIVQEMKRQNHLHLSGFNIPPAEIPNSFRGEKLSDSLLNKIKFNLLGD